jgi:hypothetical protein
MQQSSVGVVCSRLLFPVLLLVFADVSWASVASCATTATLDSFNTGVTPTGTGNGCFDIDKSFTNFSVANASTGGGLAQSNSTDQITGTNTFSAVTSPWSVTTTFTPTVAADWSVSGRASPTFDTINGTINMVVNSNGAFIAPGTGAGQNNQYPVPIPASDRFYIQTASLGPVVGTTGHGFVPDTIVITETFCAGVAACNAADQIVLTATIGNNSSVVSSFTCVAAGANTMATCGSASSASAITVTFYYPFVQALNVSDNYTEIVQQSGGGFLTTDTLSSFGNVFGGVELSPEPSTFVLLGTALLGLGALRFARRAKA